MQQNSLKSTLGFIALGVAIIGVTEMVFKVL